MVADRLRVVKAIIGAVLLIGLVIDITILLYTPGITWALWIPLFSVLIVILFAVYLGLLFRTGLRRPQDHG
jgi:uncharacterized oligopeptide transporter (OPT) family protein